MLKLFFLQTLSAASDTITAVAEETTSSGFAETASELTGMTPEGIKQAVTAFALSFAVKLIKVLLIWFVGRWVLKRVVKLLKRIMEKHVENVSVRSFVVSIIDVVVMIMLILMIIGVLGIDTSSFIAIFASAGVAIGMALSGTLQNFAGGVMILLFRPFKVGDFIEAQGVAGTVKEIQIFNTIVHTGDNKVILLPNGPVSTGIINNYSRAPLRRVDFTFSISYGDDFNKAKEVLLALVAEDERVLTEPAAPFVELGALAASSIDLTVRLWCKQEDYWGIKFDLNRKVYETFPKHGLNFPYQTFTVNVTKE
ncbi:MAG: mechanosensitive ion channel [Bacteroidaceae bacterium]|nr:mechanosensitive ion channel [Bacteroidaceae bacterium]